MENDLYINQKRSIYKSKMIYIQIVFLSLKSHVSIWKSPFSELSDFKIRFFLTPYLESFQTRLRCWKLFSREKNNPNGMLCFSPIRSERQLFHLYVLSLISGKILEKRNEKVIFIMEKWNKYPLYTLEKRKITVMFVLHKWKRLCWEGR